MGVRLHASYPQGFLDLVKMFKAKPFEDQADPGGMYVGIRHFRPEMPVAMQVFGKECWNVNL